jgi:hypothetical protein
VLVVPALGAQWPVVDRVDPGSAAALSQPPVAIGMRVVKVNDTDVDELSVETGSAVFRAAGRPVNLKFRLPPPPPLSAAPAPAPAAAASSSMADAQRGRGASDAVLLLERVGASVNTAMGSLFSRAGGGGAVPSRAAADQGDARWGGSPVPEGVPPPGSGSGGEAAGAAPLPPPPSTVSAPGTLERSAR